MVNPIEKDEEELTCTSDSDSFDTDFESDFNDSDVDLEGSDNDSGEEERDDERSTRSSTSNSNNTTTDSSNVRRRKRQYKTPKQLKILFSAFQKDPLTPRKYSDRLKELCATTKLTEEKVVRWFLQKQRSVTIAPIKRTPRTWKELTALLKAYGEDSKSPGIGTARLDQVCTDSGLDQRVIQSWFSYRRQMSAAQVERLYGVKAMAKKKQMEFLLEAFEKDTATPPMESSLMKRLCAATKMDAIDVRSWFRRYRHYTSRSTENFKKRAADKKKQWESCEPLKTGATSFTKKLETKTPEQKKILMDSFEEDPVTPTGGSDRLNELAALTKLHPKVVQKWFLCRRKTVQKAALKKPEQMRNEKENFVLIPQLIQRTPEEKAILRAAYNLDPKQPSTGSARLVELCAATGLTHLQVQKWFQRATQLRKEKGLTCDWVVPVRRNSEKEKELLNAAFNEDFTMPKARGDRMKKLCEATGLNYKAIQNWFWRRQKEAKVDVPTNRKSAQQNEIVRAAYEEDPQTPSGIRMEKLCAATGLTFQQIWDSFAGYRRTARRQAMEAQPKTGSKTPRIDTALGMKKRIKAENIDDQMVSMVTQREQENKEVRGWQLFDATSYDDDELRNVFQLETETVRTNSFSNKKKCAICNCVRADNSISIVSPKEAKRMDEHFHSSLVHFLAFTCAVRVCKTHIEEHRESCKIKI